SHHPGTQPPGPLTALSNGPALFPELGNRRRIWIKYGIDLGLWLSATPLAFALRLEQNALAYADALLLLLVIGLPVKAAAVYLLRLPWRSWYKVGIKDLAGLIQGIAVVTVVMTALGFFFAGTATIPRSIPLIEAMLNRKS